MPRRGPDKDEGVQPVTDRREIRAAHLLFLAQPARILDHSEEAATTDERKLDDLLGRDDAYLDMLVAINMKKYDLRLFSTHEGPPLPGSGDASRACHFYPQTGLIGFPLQEDPEKKPLASVVSGFGVPLHPQVLLTMVPKSVHEAWLQRMARGMFQAFSVGLTDACRRIVIPSTVADRYEQADLKMRIRAMRGFAKKIVEDMARMKQLIGEMHRRAGLVP